MYFYNTIVCLNNTLFETVVNIDKNKSIYDYKVYNHLCPNFNSEPNSNIVEYAEDVKKIIEEHLDEEDDNNNDKFYI